MSMTIRKLAFGGLLVALAACSKPPMVQPEQAVEREFATWRPFSSDSVWNTRIPANPAIDAESKALISEFAANGGLYINISEWSVPVYYIDMAAVPKYDVINLYEGRVGRGFESPRAIPIPDAASPAKNTGFIAIVDKAKNLEWDMSQAFRREDGFWLAGFGAVTNLRGTGVSKPWNETELPVYAASALPSGFPLSAGLIRVDEIEAGYIPHALMFAYPDVRTGAFVPPASTALPPADPRDTGMPLGARIQLDPAFDVEASTLSREGKIIARALQEYGAFLGERAGANALFAEAGPEQLAAWDGVLAPNEVQAVFTPEMMAKHFRLIEMGDVLKGQPAP